MRRQILKVEVEHTEPNFIFWEQVSKWCLCSPVHAKETPNSLKPGNPWGRKCPRTKKKKNPKKLLGWEILQENVTHHLPVPCSWCHGPSVWNFWVFDGKERFQEPNFPKIGRSSSITFPIQVWRSSRSLLLQTGKFQHSSARRWKRAQSPTLGFSTQSMEILEGVKAGKSPLVVGQWEHSKIPVLLEQEFWFRMDDIDVFPSLILCNPSFIRPKSRTNITCPTGLSFSWIPKKPPFQTSKIPSISVFTFLIFPPHPSPPDLFKAQ